jgi:alpha-galactosidase
MIKRTFFVATYAAAVFVAATSSRAQGLASSPPMGWNSWDSYSFTIDEEQFKANASVLASLRQYGWQYAVIDEGWYMANPNGNSLEERKYLWNGNGLLIPDSARFPSAANDAGFKPLADWIHAQGLKFGLHIVRGIPRQVVAANLPIDGSSYHATDAADTSSPCPWDQGNWGIKDNAAGQAYYDSMFRLFASWGLDFIKVDCISDHPYRPSEIRQIATAIRRSGRPVVLSLSPGPTALELATEVAQYAQMWRIADDHWDGWTFPHKPGEGEFPTGVRDMFDRLAKWFPYVGPGTWPDADMLPEGYLGPRPGWGDSRESRLTQDEQRTEFTLWAVARAPLILGTNLTRLDPYTRSLITNREVIAINQTAVLTSPDQPAVSGKGSPWGRTWVIKTGGLHPKTYLAIFNLNDVPVRWNLPLPHQRVRDVWNESDILDAYQFPVEIGAHGCALFRLE